jgi:hypothetical protein
LKEYNDLTIAGNVDGKLMNFRIKNNLARYGKAEIVVSTIYGQQSSKKSSE